MIWPRSSYDKAAFIEPQDKEQIFQLKLLYRLFLTPPFIQWLKLRSLAQLRVLKYCLGEFTKLLVNIDK